MKKETITIHVNNEIEAKEVRQRFNESSFSDKYKLNIIISGNEDPAESLGSFLLS